MILSILEKINSINEFLFSPIDNIVEKFGLDNWIADAIIDSVHLLPFLFIIFLIIEILEFYFSQKIHSLILKTKKRSIFIASLASIFPQCGFSVMASSLYSKKYITTGCLIAVYLGTSDECLPILLAHPEKSYLVVPVVLAKFIIAITAGYMLDFISLKFNKEEIENSMENYNDTEQIGCCHHTLETRNKRELIIHPIFHTINIFAFIFVITLFLNYILDHLSLSDILIKQTNELILCSISSLIGFIPNCAVSIAITMMLIKGHISFGVAMAGLLSNSGLGLIILLKNNDMKNNLKIISIVFIISLISGLFIDILAKILFH